ncbi:primosomal protein N' [Bernardetia sp. ABR2-2B]|uniref:replication restart helicase PriA n=1 Tax=Bernardetia sp. ABR2-2B TaxID=3127472 RepID=UPI0030CBDBDF
MSLFQSFSDSSDAISTERKTLFAEVIIPVPLKTTFTYRIPFELNDFIQSGVRVVVPFGRKRVLTGIVKTVTEKAPKGYSAKYILELLDEEPLITQTQLWFWSWIASYYMCSVGEVMNATLPSGLKLSSTSRLQLHPDWKNKINVSEEEKLNIARLYDLSEEEIKLIELLEIESSLTYEQAGEKLDLQDIYQIIKKLIQKRIVIIFEELKEKYIPLKEKQIRIAEKYATQEGVAEAFTKTTRSARQEELLLTYLSKNPIKDYPKSISKKELLGENLSPSSLKTLIKNGIFEEFEKTLSRFEFEEWTQTESSINLTSTQEKAVNQIFEHFQTKSTVLLHGVTGSGKTEMYVSLIEQVLQSGSQVLMLLPEIALTSQIVVRLKRIFGNAVGVYHSRFSDNERVEVWKGVLNGDINFVIGVRSSVFLPFEHLGLIIVDEEHDPSYKQYDPAPRYHARDAALVLAHKHNAKVVLGSATPSVESYYLAKQKQYGLVEVLQRFGEATLPEIQLVDLRESKKRKELKEQFTLELFEQMKTALEKEEQVLLFQNRRGYAPYLSCEVCEWIPECQNCSVSLTYHQRAQELRCHYCGFSTKIPQTCSACSSTKVYPIGFGTQKLEEDLQVMLPESRIARMDRDTTRTKTGYEKIIDAFEKHEVDILVGTQMITKGLDFEKVNLVGVFDADRILFFPDFRSSERFMQLVMQVSGRAGRRSGNGRVVIQTNSPSHPLFAIISLHDYQTFYNQEIVEREQYSYPPFARLIKLMVRHEERDMAQKAAFILSKKLQAKLSAGRVLGPEAPIIERIRNKFQQAILIKLERNQFDLVKTKEFIQSQIDELYKDKSFKKMQVVVDVDFV